MPLINLVISQVYNKTLFRYLIVGGISFAIDFLLFWFFLTVLDIFYLYSATLSFILATSLNFYFSQNFAFKGLQKYSSANTFWLIFLASILSLMINMGFLYTFYELLLMHIFVSKVLAAGIAFICNYSLRKFLIFKNDLFQQEE
jgi:putative flippase GtrA